MDEKDLLATGAEIKEQPDDMPPAGIDENEPNSGDDMHMDEAPQQDTKRAARPHRRGPRAMEVALFCISLVLVAGMLLSIGCTLALAGAFGGLFSIGGVRQSPPAGSYSILSVEGSIATGNRTGYQHTATVNYINKMAEDEGNTGLLLNMNTPGGGVYESDEVYRALMRYKEATGRPVWAYMGKNCASGGYYICAAADYIIANPGTTTGSIGVYYQLTDTSGLYEMFGIETVLIRSGENKGVGTDGVEITQSQREVYQGLVDEYYAKFVQIVMDARGMNESTVRTLGDGRPYTASQALANGLVDELGEWADAKDAFAELTGSEGYTTSFVATNALQSLIRSVMEALPMGDAQALIKTAEEQPSGLMASAEGL